MTQMPDGWLPPGIVDALTEACKYAGGLTVIGGAFAWGFSRVESWWSRRQADRDKSEQRQADRDRAEDERQLVERQFFDERTRDELARLEHERDEARRAERAAQDARERQRDRDRDEIDNNRDGWVICLHEARRCQQLIIAMHRRPPEAGSDPPLFDPLPDFRRDVAAEPPAPS